VLDPVPARAGPVAVDRVLQGVEGDPDRSVADGVDGDLEAGGVGRRDSGGQGVVVPDRLGEGPVRVGGGERRGAAVDDAVHHELHAGHAQPG
jgi:hypothetical protein